MPDNLSARFKNLTTAHLADACVRAGIEVRCAPTSIKAITGGMHVTGRALPAQHAGSVDVFLEAINGAKPGDILIADNGGRVDESCVGDLIAHEAASAGLSAIVIWGLHRDTADLTEIGIPVFSMGSIPTGPLRADARPNAALDRARIGDQTVTRDDLVAADADGVLFLPYARALELFDLAESIRDTERRQAREIVEGKSLRSQVQFERFLAARITNPALTFREHLRSVGGEIEV